MAREPHRPHQRHARAAPRVRHRRAPGCEALFSRTYHQLPTSRRDRIPERIQRTVVALSEEVCALDTRIAAIEDELEHVALEEPVIQALRKIPGIGTLTATALFATIGDIHAFKSGRQLACWLGLTPREFSSGGTRRLGRISKQRVPYVRMLLIHGARSALWAARRYAAADLPLTQLQAWALKRAAEGHANRAAVALANKLARIAWAVWHHDREFDGNHVIRNAA
jgi:transposase